MSTTFTAPVSGEVAMIDGLDALFATQSQPQPPAPLAATDPLAAPVTETPAVTETTPELDLEASIAALAAAESAPVPKIKEAWGAYQASQDLLKPVAEGGIGHIPTAAEIRDYYAGAQSFNAAVADLQEGNIENFVTQMEALAPGVGEMLAAKLGVIKPETQAQIETRGQQALITKIWADIQSTDEPNIKAHWTKVADDLHRYLTKSPQNPRGMPIPAGGPQFAAPEENPEVKRYREERDALLNTGKKQAVAAWENAYFTGRDREIAGAVEEMLKPWRSEDGSRKVTPIVYETLQRALKDAAITGLKENGYTTNQLQVLLGQARGRVATNPAEGQEILDRALRLIRTSVAPVLQRARVELARKNTMVATAPVPPRVPMAAAAGSPGAPGRAPGTGQLPPMKPGQTSQEWIESALAAITS